MGRNSIRIHTVPEKDRRRSHSLTGPKEEKERVRKREREGGRERERERRGEREGGRDTRHGNH